MHKILFRAALVVGAAAAVAGCKKTATVNNIVTNDTSANMSMTAPGNDRSAVESNMNTMTTPPPAMSNSSATNMSNGSAGRSTSGGSSGNNVESNTVGM